MQHFAHHSEENYLKTLYKLQDEQVKKVNNIALSKALDLNPATVLEMIRKLYIKKLVEILPDKTIRLTDKGKQKALQIIRKHRIWEVFLVDRLNYKWNEVHDLAEQLEHIQSERLIDRLDDYLGNPKSDPHGDPIPNANGVFAKSKSVLLSQTEKGMQGKFVGVTDHSPSFLTYLDKLGLSLGDTLHVKTIEDFDQSYTLQLKGKKQVIVSYKVANSLLVSQ